MFITIDNELNHVTMYRLVLYYLLVLVGAALVFGFFHVLPYSPENLIFSTSLIVAACWVSNVIFARLYGAVANIESVYITGLILALIITPVVSTDYAGIAFIIYASVWAMASKYIFALGKKHIFNPAAFGVALSALTIDHAASWWVGGNLPLLPFVFFGGLLIVRKVRRFDVIAVFAFTAFATVAITAPTADYLTPISRTLLHSSFFFLAFAMLTEPLTMPASWVWRIPYGAAIGFLFAPNIHIGSFYSTPELALLTGNLFAYIVNPKGRFMLTLREKKKIADGAFEFIFASDRRFAFHAGQYLEWTLGHKFADNRGNRRFFTIASSPTEDTVRIGVKFYEPVSTFKRMLTSMKVGDFLSASHLAGSFVLPRDKKKKLVFLAGGIGVTPFRSMAQFLLDTKDMRPVVLLYSNKTAAEIAYRDIFDRAQKELGWRVVYAVTNERTMAPGVYGAMIDAALIGREVPDYKNCMFYISGPHGMVEAFKKTLVGMGVARLKIKADYFPGFA